VQETIAIAVKDLPEEMQEAINDHWFDDGIKGQYSNFKFESFYTLRINKETLITEQFNVNIMASISMDLGAYLATLDRPDGFQTEAVPQIIQVYMIQSSFLKISEPGESITRDQLLPYA
jgi:hypothetical protein